MWRQSNILLVYNCRFADRYAKPCRIISAYDHVYMLTEIESVKSESTFAFVWGSSASQAFPLMLLVSLTITIKFLLLSVKVTPFWMVPVLSLCKWDVYSTWHNSSSGTFSHAHISMVFWPCRPTQQTLPPCWKSSSSSTCCRRPYHSRYWRFRWGYECLWNYKLVKSEADSRRKFYSRGIVIISSVFVIFFVKMS